MRILRETDLGSNSTAELLRKLISVADGKSTCTIESALSAWNVTRPGDKRFDGITGHDVVDVLSALLDDINRDCPSVFDAIKNTTTYIGTCVVKGCRVSTHTMWTILFKEPDHVCIDDILKARHESQLACCGKLVPSPRIDMILGPLIVVCSSCEEAPKFESTFRDYALVAIICGIHIEAKDASHDESIDSHYVIGINQTSKQ